MCWFKIRHILVFLFLTLFIFVSPVFSQTVQIELDGFIDSTNWWVWNIKQYHEEVAKQDEIISYFKKNIEQHNILSTLEKQTRGELKNDIVYVKKIIEEKIQMVLYLIELSPDTKYADILKQLIKNKKLPDYIRANAVVSLGSTKTSPTYILDLLDDPSEHLSRASLHIMALIFASESNIELLKGLVDKISNKANKINGALRAELIDVESLIVTAEKLNGEKELVDKVNYLLRFHLIATIAAGSPNNRVEDLSTKYVLEQIRVLFAHSPDVVVNMLHKHWQTQEEERVNTLYILLDLKIPLNEEEQGFYNDMLENDFSPCVEKLLVKEKILKIQKKFPQKKIF